jgi:hypothetical protein
MNVVDIVSLVKDIVTIVAVLTAGIVAIFVYFQLAPVLKLRILPRWTDDTRQFLLIRFEVENSSKVRVSNPTGRIQILEYKPQPLSHWVPFTENDKRPEEEPIAWRDPVPIFGSTKRLYPGEVITLERLYHCKNEAFAIHIGLQVEVKLGYFGRAVTSRSESLRQTTTCIIVK